jgi:hypothetical protein
VRAPERFERWSLIVAIVHNLLILARVVVAVEPRPWENKHREPTPQQVRQGLNKLLPQLGMPTRPLHNSGENRQGGRNG